MKQEDYSNYYINDLIRDLSDDYKYVKNKIAQFLKLKEYFEKFQIIWGYITCVLFVIYGVKRLIDSEDLVFPIIIFAFSLVYAVITTVLLLTNKDGKEEQKEKKKNLGRLRKIFKYVSYTIKITIIMMTLISVNTSDIDSTNVIVLNLLTIFWMALSILIDIVVAVVNKMLNLLKEFCLREIERTKAAVKNTINAPVKFGSEILSKAGGFVKGIFTKKKDNTETLVDEPKNDNPFDD